MKYIALAAILASTPAWAQTAPPKGPKWLEAIADGKTEASSRGVPILMLAGEKGGAGDALGKSFEDPKIVAILRWFTCVFVCRDYKLDKYQLSFTGWLGDTAQSQYNPPALVFGDSKGNNRKEFRIEGKSLTPDELLEHLFKVIKAVSPEQFGNARAEVLALSPLPDLIKMLGDSIAALGDNLTADKAAQFQEELANANVICKALTPKIETIKDKKAKPAVNKQLGEAKKWLEKLAKFQGKAIDQYKGHLDKAKEAFEAMKKAAEEAKE